MPVSFVSFDRNTDIPLELEHREESRAVIAAAKEEIVARAQARFEAEQADYERKLAERQARAEMTGKKPGGKPPKAPKPGPQERPCQRQARNRPRLGADGRLAGSDWRGRDAFSRQQLVQCREPRSVRSRQCRTLQPPRATKP